MNMLMMHTNTIFLYKYGINRRYSHDINHNNMIICKPSSFKNSNEKGSPLDDTDNG